MLYDIISLSFVILTSTSRLLPLLHWFVRWSAQLRQLENVFLKAKHQKLWVQTNI